MRAKCRHCSDCKSYGRSRNTLRSFGCKHYYCENEEAKKIPQKEFGSKAALFVGFGENTMESKLKLKTAPRWCPKNRKKEADTCEK